jgi:hypothetical protein
MAVAKVVLNLNHDGVAYHQGDTVEADIDTLKALEKAGVVEKVIDVIDGEVVDDKPAIAAENTSEETAEEQPAGEPEGESTPETDDKPAAKKGSKK